MDLHIQVGNKVIWQDIGCTGERHKLLVLDEVWLDWSGNMALGDKYHEPRS